MHYFGQEKQKPNFPKIHAISKKPKNHGLPKRLVKKPKFWANQYCTRSSTLIVPPLKSKLGGFLLSFSFCYLIVFVGEDLVAFRNAYCEP